MNAMSHIDMHRPHTGMPTRNRKSDANRMCHGRQRYHATTPSRPAGTRTTGTFFIPFLLDFLDTYSLMLKVRGVVVYAVYAVNADYVDYVCSVVCVPYAHKRTSLARSASISQAGNGRLNK